MQGSLEIRDQNEVVQIINLSDYSHKNEILIGRDTSANDLSLPSREISRQHARLVCESGKILFFDNSNNGSLINDQKIVRTSASLQHGDVIKLSKFEILFRDHEIDHAKADQYKTQSVDDIHNSTTEKSFYFSTLEKSQNQLSSVKINSDKYFTIGSDEKCTYVIGEEGVGEEHCLVRFYRGVPYIESPVHMTLRNNAEVGGSPVELKNNDIIKISNLYFKFMVKGIEHDNTFTYRHDIVTQDESLLEILDEIEVIAKSEMPILIIGESGTGKELIAKAIHNSSSRAKKAYISVNCTTIQSNLAESQLFGHVKGAFTGAINDSDGFFVKANNGSLFLDEIGEINESIQVKLLRAIENNAISRVGDGQERKVNVRIVAATNKDISDPNIRNSIKFRDDLFYRLNCFKIVLPPLKDRKDDIELLMKHFLKLAKVKDQNLPEYEFSEKCIEDAKNYNWPGNIRELQNVCFRTFYRHINQGTTIDKLYLEPEIGKPLVKAPQNKKEWKQTIIGPDVVESKFFPKQFLDYVEARNDYVKYKQKLVIQDFLKVNDGKFNRQWIYNAEKQLEEFVTSFYGNA